MCAGRAGPARDSGSSWDGDIPLSRCDDWWGYRRGERGLRARVRQCPEEVLVGRHAVDGGVDGADRVELWGEPGGVRHGGRVAGGGRDLGPPGGEGDEQVGGAPVLHVEGVVGPFRRVIEVERALFVVVMSCNKELIFMFIVL